MSLTNDANDQDCSASLALQCRPDSLFKISLSFKPPRVEPFIFFKTWTQLTRAHDPVNKIWLIFVVRSDYSFDVSLDNLISVFNLICCSLEMQLASAECSVCFEEFDEQKTRALIQPCGHAKTCLPCAINIFSQSTLCPICRVKMSAKPKPIPYKLFMWHSRSTRSW